MANELRIDYIVTGVTLYAVVSNQAGQVWNGTEFVERTPANWSDYAILLEEGEGTYYYAANMPQGIGEGLYTYFIYQQTDSETPAISDPKVGVNQIIWDGTKEITLDPTILSTLTNIVQTAIQTTINNLEPQLAAAIAAAVADAKQRTLFGDCYRGKGRPVGDLYTPNR